MTLPVTGIDPWHIMAPLQESCWCWHGNGAMGEHIKEEWSQAIDRLGILWYIYFHRSGQRHVEICLDSWNLFVFHGFITYHITPHHIKSHNLLLLQLPPPSFPKMSFPILFHSFPIVFPWLSRLFLLFLHLYGSDLMDLATFSSSMAIMPRGAMKPIATWNTTGSSYWYSQIFIATVIYV